MCSIAVLQSMVFILQILLKPFLTILDSCLTSMLRNPIHVFLFGWEF
ncbi:hypothetical protein Goarm_022166 [Gossypium armourianum]|uniref:Uncharacterized protein n=1 Tax=Gossypium armourianum TaxID=34283 RepID=A0A7J9KGU8_9ROSI|nr:hypothetical protein [Gossypium armourianum]